MPDRRMDATGAVAGGLFVVLGVLFLLDRLHVIVVAPRLVWPLLLIGLGIAVLLGARRQPRPGTPATDAPPEDGGEPSAGTDS